MQLKDRGFMIAIDDFGSGYSSLGQLQRLMADVLKLDRSFVQSDMLGDRERIVISNVIQLATQLGMAVICEGVENREPGRHPHAARLRQRPRLLLRQAHASRGF